MRWNRPLRIEPLESRNMLSISVDTLVDENNGVGVGAGTSLREAIAAATPGDTINFSVAGTITLSSLGDLVVDKSVTIAGPGASALTVHAYDPTPTQKNGDGRRVFLIDDGQPSVGSEVLISGLTITGGDILANGGGIYSREDLTINDCAISNNKAQLSFGAAAGGGIYVDRSNYGLKIENCNITGNTSGVGGGIDYQDGNGTFMIAGTTISNNDASFFGGGIRIDSVAEIEPKISDCTISGNHAASYGGGIFPTGVRELEVVNSTISGNSADQGGGGFSFNGKIGALYSLQNDTITENKSPDGGGIWLYAGYTLRINNCIISANTATDGVSPNNISVITRPPIIGSFFNIVGSNSGGDLSADLNQLDIDDPKLGPLQNNGGPTATQLPTMTSPAIDGGNPYSAYDPALFDQRGVGFSRVLNGRTDIGAVETTGPIVTIPQASPIDLNNELVPNLDFEDYTHLPTYYNDPLLPDTIAYIPTWHNLTQATPDYYNSNPGGFMGGTPAGIAPTPANGSNGFLGIFDQPSQSWSEYVANVLPSPLLPGQPYRLNLYAGTTAIGGTYGGSYIGDLVVYGLVSGSLVPTGGVARIEDIPALRGSFVELLDVPINLPAATWSSIPDQILIPPLPVEALVFGTRSDGNDRYLLIDASAPSTILGDYNRNGAVDGVDYVLWRNTMGMSVPRFSGADGNADGIIDNADYNIWRANFGNILPPGSGASAAVSTTTTIVTDSKPSTANNDSSSNYVGEVFQNSHHEPLHSPQRAIDVALLDFQTNPVHVNRLFQREDLASNQNAGLLNLISLLSQPDVRSNSSNHIDTDVTQQVADPAIDVALSMIDHFPGIPTEFS